MPLSLRADFGMLFRLVAAAGVCGSVPALARSADEWVRSDVPRADRPVGDSRQPSNLTAAPSKAEPLPPAAAGPVLTLAECIQIALQRQPTVAAARADVVQGSSGSNRSTGCDDCGQKSMADRVLKGLAIRRQQASLGSAASVAALDVAERETVYAVTRTYFTVVFAREQREVVQAVVTKLSDSLALAERFVGKPDAPRDLNENAVGRNRVFLELARARLVDAEQGTQRAKAALREAMGVEPDFCFDVATRRLPVPDAKACKEEIVALALARRGEMTQAVIGEQVTELEVEAQARSIGLKKLTFAAAADLHARPLPAGVADGEYRPGALGLEMPVFLVGPRSARVERAEALRDRSQAVVGKTRGLIALEAEDMFLRWQGAARKLSGSRVAARRAAEVAESTSRDFLGGQRVDYREVLESAVIAAQAGAEYNEVRFQHLLTLAGLERVTAGGFRAGLECLGNDGQP